jgi:hypothetical protein
MTVFARLRMPSLGGATEWLNSEPLSALAELRGGVGVVDSWTCIKRPRTGVYVHA